MAKSIINADTEGLKQTGGDTNEIEIQTNGLPAISIDASQNWVLTNPLGVDSGGTGANTAAAGLSNLGGVTTGKSIAMAIVFGG